MSVVMVIAIVVIVAFVVFLARGRGGELSAERNDYVPLDLGPVSATDVALLRPPTGLWGYSMEATDEAMDRIAESIRERDVRIVALEQLVTDLSRDQAPMPLLASPYVGARHRRVTDETVRDETLRDDTVRDDTVRDDTLRDDTEEADVIESPRRPPATQPARLPFEPPRPGGDLAVGPPERSHD